MKFAYVPASGAPRTITTLGITFEAGKAVEVTDEVKIRKLKGNPYFKEGGATVQAPPPPAPIPLPVVETEQSDPEPPNEVTDEAEEHAPRRGRPPKQ